MDQTLQTLERSYQLGSIKGVELLRAYQRAGLQDKYLKLRSELGYVAETSVLPLPTKEQTKAFVEYVATAHSWYKHLHHTNPTPFYFFLNPYVMMFVTREPIRSYSIANKGDPGLFHYSNMPTMQYREKFGYWDYQYGEDEENGSIYGEFSGPEGPIKITVPEGLVCCVGLTAQVHGRRLPGEFEPSDPQGKINKQLHEAMEEAMYSFIERLAEARRDYI